MATDGWFGMHLAPKTVDPVIGYHQILLAYPAFREDKSLIVNQGVWLSGGALDRVRLRGIPTERSIELLIEEAQDGNGVSPHVLQEGWYVTFTTLVQHGGRHYTGFSHKPTQVRVDPVAWRALPSFK